METSPQGTLLVIDDTVGDVNLLLDILTPAGFKVLIAQDGEDGFETAVYTHPDLILLDIKMFGMDGFEVCQRLKSQEDTQDIPIIFMTLLSGITDKIKAFSMGAVDYITKPIQSQELLARVFAHVKLHQQQQKINEQNKQLQQLVQQLQQLDEKLIKRTAALEKANQKLKSLSHSDGLTQIANRRYFDECLAVQWQRLTREKLPLSLIFADIDYFKSYNDTYGHQAGDECLQQIAQGIQNVVNHSSSLVARYGGEEFVVLLPKTDIEGAMGVAKNIQHTIQRLNILHAHSSACQHVTLSIGISTLLPTCERKADSLIKLADEALYEAKKQGRNRIVY